MSTIIHFKVVSTMKRFAVSDVLGVDIRKDVKKLNRLLDKANGGDGKVTNTYSTEVGLLKINEDCEKDIARSRIDVVTHLIGFLDSLETDSLKDSVKAFHITVAAEKQKLKDEYGNTSIPAERYRQYLEACRKVEVTVWSTQLVVTKESDREFPDAVYNSTSGRYHCTIKTKTVYTSYPVKAETLLNANVIKPVNIKIKDSDGNEIEKTVYEFEELGQRAIVSAYKRKANGRVELATVTDSRTGEPILILRKKV